LTQNNYFFQTADQPLWAIQKMDAVCVSELI